MNHHCFALLIEHFLTFWCYVGETNDEFTTKLLSPDTLHEGNSMGDIKGIINVFNGSNRDISNK